MAERKVKFEQGNYYHIYNRGANKGAICRGDEDFTNILFRMREYCAKYQVTIIAYSLMWNHYHWLVRQDSEIEARLLPQRVFNGYTKWFNHKYNRTGTLFEGPFKSPLVDKAQYLQHLPRYIHGNPVKDGFAMSPDLWPYSNYAEWVGIRNGSLVDHDFINERYPNREDYSRSVFDYLSGNNNLPLALRRYLEKLYKSNR